ncbi:hypothetical protein CDD82_7644 [Ophiocordyceps australis]|uniref:Uncharacterized protein n=1 Tax=Ophiocordyceps australis TaxID=1399860 RepID=A0A2C5YUV7_9HYPO|nr:hypothetical protein CDD82_7644 [Ophiocordyceps australis]
MNRRLLFPSARHLLRPNICQKRQFYRAPILMREETVSSTSMPVDEGWITALKVELAQAMRTRDAIKSLVLRNILGTYTQARARGEQKTRLDFALLIRKIQRQMLEAADQAQDAGRKDVYAREMAQLELVEQYMQSKNFTFLTDQEILGAAKPKLQAAIDAQIDKKTWIKHILSHLDMGQMFGGKLVDKNDLRRVVSKMCREQDMKDAEEKKQADS